jgi:transcriptional regulator with XRE-family HTH domain
MASLDEGARLQLKALGDFIRHQRHMAEMSLRDLASRTNVSNPYLSQIERGLHEPSVRVLKAIATALNLSAESLLTQAGLLEDEAMAASEGQTAAVIEKDPRLKPEQRTALLAVYQSYIETNDADAEASGETRSPGSADARAEEHTPHAKKPRTKARGSVKKTS